MAGGSKGEDAKGKGNDAFRKGQFAEAIGYYTEAILSDVTNHIYYLNRSQAYLKLSKYEDAERDASASLRLESSSVKAYFRRGAARKHLSKWEEAREDFQEVLRLDPKNAEAKAEVVALQEKLKALKTASMKVPLDARKLHPRPKPAQESTRPTSSVEAARNFLEKVGMTDEQGTAAPPVHNNIPDRLPGETGSFLKEVSTRRLVKKPAEATTLSTITPANDTASPTRSIPIDMPTREESREMVSPTVINPRSPQNGNSGELQLSAYEFFARLRQCSDISDRLELMKSLDVQSIPSMLGSLLEPELLADILETLLHADETQRDLVVDLMSVLPRCDRFETALMFLEHSEKQRAITILDRIRKEDGHSSYKRLATLWKV